VRFRDAIAASIALLLWCGSASGDEDDPKRFSWHPSLTLTTVADDDPNLDRGKGGAVGLWFAPNLELGYRADAYELSADIGADVRRYFGENGLSEEFGRVRASGEVGLYPGLTVRLEDAFVPVPERIAAPADETSNLIQANQLDLEMRYWRELAKKREILFALRGTYFTGEDFAAILLTDGGGLFGQKHFDPEHVEAELVAEFQSPLAERSAWYIRGTGHYRSFEETIVPDHADLAAMLGVRSRWFHNVELDVAAGWGVIQFESRDDVQRFVGEGSLRFRQSNGWTWTASAANRFVADVSGNNFVETTGRLGIEKFFGDDTRLSGAVFISRLENDAWETDSNLFGGVEIRGSHRLDRHTEISLTYRFWQNAGDYSADDFDQHRLALELVYRH